MSQDNPIKVLIADDDGLISRRLAEFLGARGFEARVASDVGAARAAIDAWEPRFALVDLVLPDGGALAVIDHVRWAGGPRRRTTGVIVTSAHNAAANVREVIARGARDYLVKPLGPEDVYRRLVYHARGHRRPAESAQAGPAGSAPSAADEAALMLQLTDLILQQALRDTDLEEILFNLARMVNLRLDGARCSIIAGIDPQTGVVVTSSDDRDAYGIRLDLNQYPEVAHVLNTQRSIAVDDLADAVELRHVPGLLQDVSFNALIVSPVTRHDQPFGVLSLRLPEGRGSITDAEIRFVEIVARVSALVLNGRRHQVTRDYWDRPDPRGTLQFPPRAKNS